MMSTSTSSTNPSQAMSASLNVPCVSSAEKKSTSNSLRVHVLRCSTSCMTTLTWSPAKKDSQTTPRRKPTSKAASPVTSLDQKQKHSPSALCSAVTTSSKAPSHSSSVTTAKAKMAASLSDETRKFWDDYIAEHFPGPPSEIDLPNKSKPLLI